MAEEEAADRVVAAKQAQIKESQRKSIMDWKS
jgi:hypothetical protein